MANGGELLDEVDVPWVVVGLEKLDDVRVIECLHDVDFVDQTARVLDARFRDDLDGPFLSPLQKTHPVDRAETSRPYQLAKKKMISKAVPISNYTCLLGKS